MTDLVERLETLVRHGRDQGMKMNDVEDAAREIKRLRTVAQQPPKPESVAEALAFIKEAKDLLVLAYKATGYKSKINSAVWRLTYAERALAAQSPAAPVETLNEQAREHPRYDNPRDPFASPDRLPPRSSAGTDEATEGCGDVLLEAKKPGGEWVKIYPAQLEWMVELGYFARATQKVTE